MAVTYYIDGSGNYLGAFEGATPSTSPHYEVASPPDYYNQVWSINTWVDSLASAKTARLAALVAQQQSHLAAGYTAGGHTYAIDPTSMTAAANLSDFATQCATSVSGATWDSNQKYPDINGAAVTVSTAATWLTVSRGAFAKALAITNNYNSIAASINAAGSVSAVNAIDVTAGWPA